jgi:acyl-[acyl-carrier-protein]-phospholipid O-acyltransferase/long-chain-fatty-acid--[acyl-carrier-protein] ligase
VVLSHRNLMSVLTQLQETPLLRTNDIMLGCLPLFHSFGLSVTFWYPLLNGVRLVTLPSPLDAGGVAEACKEERITVLLGTPTFLRHYLKKVTKEHAVALRTVVAGAEKVPAALVKDYQEKLGLAVYEGYGLTETSPVLSINLEHPPKDMGDDSMQFGNREGSVGRLLPGISGRLVDAETGEEGVLDKTGLLEVRGENIFASYLGNPKATEEAFHDGWFRTGDLARFDEEGFLFIEGRLSRFSKIGGEMVSHGAVEGALAKVIPAHPGGGPSCVVVGIPDESKGEALVLLTTVEVDKAKLLETFKEAGLPNLWVPKKIVKVEEIPLLGSGKVDLRKCKEMAAEAQEVGKNS